MSNAFQDIEFNSPSLDISCADGLFTFVHFGGQLDFDFDYYKTTQAKNFKHNSFVDIYDTYEKNYEVSIISKPKIKIDYGTDWKENLLKKAAKLDFYNNLVVHDNNNPLPFENDFFKTIYSNSIYWVKNVENILSEIKRTLHPNGKAILQVMTPNHLETLLRLEKILSPNAISILDRKRRETMPGLKTFREWEKLIIEQGFTISEVRSTYPDRLILDIWNIGLRPIAHLLIQMTDNIQPELRQEIKKEWVEIFSELFKPLLELKTTYSMEDSPYPCFILTK